MVVLNLKRLNNLNSSSSSNPKKKKKKKPKRKMFNNNNKLLKSFHKWKWWNLKIHPKKRLKNKKNLITKLWVSHQMTFIN